MPRLSYSAYQACGSVHARVSFTLVNLRLTVDPRVPADALAAVARAAHHIVAAGVVSAWRGEAVVDVHLAPVTIPSLGACTREAVGASVVVADWRDARHRARLDDLCTPRRRGWDTVGAIATILAGHVHGTLVDVVLTCGARPAGSAAARE